MFTLLLFDELSFLKKIFFAIIALYLTVCGLLFFYQEKLIYFPAKLDANYAYSMGLPKEELWIDVDEKTKINGLLVKADSSKGVIFYLHGNGGNVEGWSQTAPVYTALGYDVFYIDYRGFGKSGGKIESLKQLYSDMQICYDTICRRYDEKNVIALGYSIGTGIASYLAAHNHPRMLILQAPYTSIKSMTQHKFPWLPSFLVLYNLNNEENTKQVRCPVINFHGIDDQTIPVKMSESLSAQFKKGDTLIKIKSQGHNDISSNSDYQSALKSILQ